MTESATLDRTAAAENLKLQLKRVIKASRERVFEAWTKPELLREWFGPGNMTVADAAMEVRIGGSYRIEMRGSGEASEGGSEGTDMSRGAMSSGIYEEIVPNELLRFTWRGNWEPSEETLVTIAFKDVEGGTEVTLTHERFATAKSQGGHQQGWSASLDKLQQFCEG